MYTFSSHRTRETFFYTPYYYPFILFYDYYILWIIDLLFFFLSFFWSFLFTNVTYTYNTSYTIIQYYIK